MADKQTVLEADAARRNSMIAGDVDTLAEYLNDDLVWTHSSGRTDDKAAVLDAIASKSVVYLSLATDAVRVDEQGDIRIVSGTLNGQVTKDGAQRALRNKFLSVWKRDGASFKMLAWQSTGF